MAEVPGSASAPVLDTRLTGVCVVIPVLDEEASIGGVIQRIPRDAVDEIIVADGGSKDRTIEIAKAMGARVLHAGKGYGRACLAGAAAASEIPALSSIWMAMGAIFRKSFRNSSRPSQLAPMIL